MVYDHIQAAAMFKQESFSIHFVPYWPLSSAPAIDHLHHLADRFSVLYLHRIVNGHSLDYLISIVLPTRASGTTQWRQLTRVIRHTTKIQILFTRSHQHVGVQRMFPKKSTRRPTLHLHQRTQATHTRRRSTLHSTFSISDPQRAIRVRTFRIPASKLLP